MRVSDFISDFDVPMTEDQLLDILKDCDRVDISDKQIICNDKKIDSINGDESSFSALFFAQSLKDERIASQTGLFLFENRDSCLTVYKDSLGSVSNCSSGLLDIFKCIQAPSNTMNLSASLDSLGTKSKSYLINGSRDQPPSKKSKTNRGSKAVKYTNTHLLNLFKKN
jgi:hypothetical protein